MGGARGLCHEGIGLPISHLAGSRAGWLDRFFSKGIIFHRNCVIKPSTVPTDSKSVCDLKWYQLQWYSVRRIAFLTVFGT